MTSPTYINSAEIMRCAEAALSPCYAWNYTAPMRRMWPTMHRDPDQICAHFSRNEHVKRLIWC